MGFGRLCSGLYSGLPICPTPNVVMLTGRVSQATSLRSVYVDDLSTRAMQASLMCHRRRP